MDDINKKLYDLFKAHGRIDAYVPGQYLVEKGMPADKCCFIMSGTARAFCTNSAGDDITLFYISKRQLICSEALTPNSTVNVNVQALTTVQMSTIPHVEFYDLCQKVGIDVRDLIIPLISRLILLSDYICCAHFSKSTERVAYFLYSSYLRSGPYIEFTHAQIADITGVNRISVNRVIRSLKEDGILKPDHRKIVVLEPEKLKNYFHSVGYLLD